MNLEIKPDLRRPGINKQAFQLKTSRRDGLILQVHHSIPGVSGEVHRVRFLQATFDETGNLLATSDHRGNIFVIDLGNRKFWMLPNLGSSTVISFLPGRKNLLLVGTSSCIVQLVNIELGTITATLEGHAEPPKQVTFSSSGQYCLTAAAQEAVIWDLNTNTQAHRLTLRKDTAVKKVIFMPVTDNILACFEDDAMHIWKFDTFEVVKQILPETWKSHHLKSIAFTRDGRGMIIGGHSKMLVVFSLDAWCVKKVIELPEDIAGVRYIEFLPQLFDGGANKILGLLSSHCTLHFIDIETSTFLKCPFIPQGTVSRFVCSSNGKYIACVLQSGEVNIYATSQLLESNSPDEPLCVEKADGVHSPELDGGDAERKQAIQRKNKEALKQNLNKVHKQIKESLDLNRLQPILKEFGEYPESYRALIWRTILQLPSNQAAYVSLVKRDVHPAFLHLDEQYPLENRTALKNLKRLLSCMTHWSPVFGEVKFLPLFVFPFVKVFQNDPFVCFEAVITIILNWCQHWFEYFPFPPVNVLSMVENVLAEHDSELLEFYYVSGVTSQLYAWTLLEVAFSEVLSRSEWLCLWDHVLSNEPAFLLMAVVAYNIMCRRAIMSCKTCSDFEYFFHNQNPVDMKRLLAKTYSLCAKTSTEVHPRQYLGAFKPLEKGSYPVFSQYPKFIVDYKAHQIEQLRQDEECVKKEFHEAMSRKADQEKRMNEVKQTELQEKRLQDLEETYREMLAKEESRVTDQRKKLVRLRRGLRAREIELLNAAKNRVMKKNVQKRQITLNRLLEDIEHKRTLQESELLAAEEEMEHHFMELLTHKHNLELQLGSSCDPEPVFSIEHRALLQQQEQLTKELRKLREEATSKLHKKEVDMATRIAMVEDLLQQTEVELAKEMAVKEQNIACGRNNIKVMKLEASTKKLEQEVGCLLDELTSAKLHESQKRLEGVAESQAERHMLNREQEHIFRLHKSTMSRDECDCGCQTRSGTDLLNITKPKTQNWSPRSIGHREYSHRASSRNRSYTYQDFDPVSSAMKAREELLSDPRDEWY